MTAPTSSRRPNAAGRNGQPDRLPPQAIEAEKGVLGCLLLDPQQRLPELASLSERAFYEPRHQILYRTVTRMVAEGQPVDLVTLVARLQDEGVLETIGGYAYLAALMDGVPSAANLSYYLWTSYWTRTAADR